MAQKGGDGRMDGRLDGHIAEILRWIKRCL